MAGVRTYWHTLRHLRPVQIFGRLRARVGRARVDLRPAPPRRALPGTRWTEPVRREAVYSPPASFTLLNETRDVDTQGWDDPAVDKLWRYNLHYFDDLAAPPTSERLEAQRALLTRWVDENPPAAGSGWEPYPTSLRIVNWVKWAWAGNQLPPACVESLAIQARWLAGHLELHLLGNHLFANAKALVFAGVYFDGPEAQAWLSRGLRILAREVPEQILPDGGQFERSPMYHALAQEDMLDLLNAVGAHGENAIATSAAKDDWLHRVQAMRHWLAAMSHPDGRISFFNDAAFGIAPAPAELERYAGRLGLGERPSVGAGLTRLEPSGYIRIADGAAVAVLDVAPVGPDYLPGHAHADTLSFELSLFGRRVFVNSGTSCYGVGPERLRQRGTGAHNTVTIDGEDSSEVWSGFRVARRAYPRDVSVVEREVRTVTASHDGYHWLSGRPRHERRWSFAPQCLTVEDRVTGGFRRAEARYHLHPDVRIVGDSRDERSAHRITLVLPAGERVTLRVQQGHASIAPTTWHPEFGLSVSNRCVVVALVDGLARVQVDWSGAE